jgi:hypothetical protein
MNNSCVPSFPLVLERCRELHEESLSLRQIAKQLKVSAMIVQRAGWPLAKSRPAFDRRVVLT